MRPIYSIGLNSFKQLSPTKCKIQYDDENEDILVCHKVRIQGTPVYRVFIDKEPFILIKKTDETFMFEENLINELKINIKEIAE